MPSMLSKLAVAACLLPAVSGAEVGDLGDVLGYVDHHHGDVGRELSEQFARTLKKFVPLPLKKTVAGTEGWTPSGPCVPHRGFPFTEENGEGPSTRHPLTMYFADNEVSGLGVTMRGMPSFPSSDYWEEVSEGRHHIAVIFRRINADCSLAAGAERGVLGDRAFVNPSATRLNGQSHLPMTATSAQAEGYVRGSCFDGMGWHWMKDLKTRSTMSWEEQNLFPLVPMYHPTTGRLAAFFFASSTVQQSLFNANEWEPIPLANFLMCKNTCDPNCGFKGTNFWSTMHIYLTDHETLLCPVATTCFMGQPSSGKGTSCCDVPSNAFLAANTVV